MACYNMVSQPCPYTTLLISCVRHFCAIVHGPIFYVMKSLFVEQGVPQRVIGDNGGHFS